MIASLVSLWLLSAPGLRTVTANSCAPVRINLGLGMATQIIFDTEPRMTLFADKDHFQIQGTKEAPRSLAVIPLVRSSELNNLIARRGDLSAASVARLVDSVYKTNLFVFFDHGQQLMFELRFVTKEKADFAIRVKRTISEKCSL